MLKWTQNINGDGRTGDAMREYTTPQTAELLGVAQSTIRKHARILGIQRIGRDYIFTPTQIDALRQSLASSKRGRPVTKLGC